MQFEKRITILTASKSYIRGKIISKARNYEAERARKQRVSERAWVCASTEYSLVAPSPILVISRVPNNIASQYA